MVSDKGGKGSKQSKKDDDKSSSKSMGKTKSSAKEKEKAVGEINEEDYIPVEKKAEIGR